MQIKCSTWNIFVLYSPLQTARFHCIIMRLFNNNTISVARICLMMAGFSTSPSASLHLSLPCCRDPSSNTLALELGIGVRHVRDVLGISFGSWDAPISRARVDWPARNLRAWGKMASRCSTALRVTTSAWGRSGRAEISSARSLITLMLVNVRARDTSFRKADFLLLDSIRVRWISGAQIVRGRAGNPAPEPISRTRVPVAGRQLLVRLSCWARKRDSPKWRGNIFFFVGGGG